MAESTGEGAGAALPARAGSGEAALPDGGRRSVTVRPDEVWSAPAARPLGVSQAAPASRMAARVERRAFLGPIVMVVALSSALLAAFVAALALLVRLRGG